MTEKEALNMALSIPMHGSGTRGLESTGNMDGSLVGALYRAWPSDKKEGPPGAWARCWIDRLPCCVMELTGQYFQ